MADSGPNIPKLFVNRFTVDYAAPFERHLNRLEVEIAREDYRHLKRVELLDEPPSEDEFAGMHEITARLLRTTQNNYNRELLQRLGVRVYLDVPNYHVYYRLSDRTLRFSPLWRERVLTDFFGRRMVEDSGWRPCPPVLPGCECRFLPDEAGGVFLLRRTGEPPLQQALLTATHGPYDPHTFEVALYFLRAGRARAAIINLGFAGREPLTDENLEKLKAWGVPLNPSNIDVIYPYVDAGGHPYCYKLEEGFRRYAGLVGPPPELVIDIHGCVGTHPQDSRLIVGLGGFPPYLQAGQVGRCEERSGVVHIFPHQPYRHGLSLLRDLSDEIYLQFCEDAHRCYHFAVLGRLQLIGRQLDPHQEARSLLAGEERTYLPDEDVRWLPGAGGNALQRIEARKFSPQVVCLHVEIPTWVRRKMALRLREMGIGASLDSSAL